METNFTGNRIAAARKQKSMSQAQLAQHLFISPQAVGKWERGESIPDIITVGKLAAVLGVDLNYFSDRASATPAPVAQEPTVHQVAGLPAPRTKGKLSRDMSRFSWVDADFSGLKDLHDKFTGSVIGNCKFIGSDLSGVLLESNHVDVCDFRGTNMSGSRIRSSHVANSRFNDGSLKGAEISDSVLKGCDLSGAVLTGVVVRSSSFNKCTFTNSILERTVFHGTDLTDVQFEGVLEDCSFEDCGFSRVTFRNATLLNTFFKSQRLKHIQFVDCKADRLTYEFLKNGKADVSGIAVLE